MGTAVRVVARLASFFPFAAARTYRDATVASRPLSRSQKCFCPIRKLLWAPVLWRNQRAPPEFRSAASKTRKPGGGFFGMRAAQIKSFGPPNVIETVELPKPVPGAGEVLVQTKAAGVAPWDALIRSNTSVTAPQLPLILGSDLSGIVESVGRGVE